MNKLKGSLTPMSPYSQLDHSSGPGPSLRKPNRNRTRQTIWDWWIYEIVCLLVCCAAVIGLIVVLRRYDGKPLKSWPWGINPNALVSAFAAAIKIMAMVPVADCLGQLKWIWFSKGRIRRLSDFEVFDSASRGISGSIWLLFRLRCMHIASLGAFITIIAVAVDPLAQQAITTPHRLVPVPGVARVLRADNYSIPGQQDGPVDGDGYRLAPNSLVGSAYIGLYTPIGQAVPFIAPICQTGNCTFTPYSSLGICTQTERIPDDIVKSTCEECMGRDNWESECHGMCRSLPTSMFNMTVLKNGVLSGYSTVDDLALNDSSSIAFPEFRWPLANIITNFKNNFTMATPSEPFNGSSTFETIFYYCVQEFNTSVVNGIVNTTLIKSGVAMINEDPGEFGEVPVLSIRPADAPDAKPFVVDPLTSESTAIALFKIFQGAVSWSGVFEAKSETGRLLSLIIDQTDYSELKKPNNYDALPGIMQNVATSVSNDMKANPGNGTEPVYHMGTASTTETYISVNWPWLSLLIATVPLSLLLLVLTMLNGLRTRTRVWKTSSLPVLQVLDETVRQDLGHLNHLMDLEERSDKIRVCLKKQSGNWSLVDQN